MARTLTGRRKTLLVRSEIKQGGKKLNSHGKKMNRTPKNSAGRVATGVLANSFSFGCHIKPEPYPNK
jgi:hypothetical protein